MRLVPADERWGSGSPGLTHGGPGDLLLAEPVADGTVRVRWSSAEPDAPPGRGGAPRSWSEPVLVPVGGGVSAARLSHFRSGPDAVELFAVAAATVRRHYRTDGAFVEAGAVRADVRACSAPVETLSEAACLVIDADGRVVLLRAPLHGYPALEWRASDLPAPKAAAVSLAVDPLGRLLAAVATGDGAEVLREDIDGWQPLGRVFGSWTDLVLLGGADPRLVGLDAFGLLQHTSVVDGYWPPPEAVWTDTVATSVAATASPADHGRVDVVLTGPHGAWHGFAKAGRDRRLRHWSEPEPLRAQISLPDEQPVGA